MTCPFTGLSAVVPLLQKQLNEQQQQPPPPQVTTEQFRNGFRLRHSTFDVAVGDREMRTEGCVIENIARSIIEGIVKVAREGQWGAGRLHTRSYSSSPPDPEPQPQTRPFFGFSAESKPHPFANWFAEKAGSVEFRPWGQSPSEAAKEQEQEQEHEPKRDQALADFSGGVLRLLSDFVSNRPDSANNHPPAVPSEGASAPSEADTDAEVKVEAEPERRTPEPEPTPAPAPEPEHEQPEPEQPESDPAPAADAEAGPPPVTDEAAQEEQKKFEFHFYNA